MANTVTRINIPISGGGGGGSQPPFENTFTISDWVLDGGFYTITTTEATHDRGVTPIVQVSELVGSNYEEVIVTIQIDTSGNVKLIIGNDSRFNGRVLIQGD